MTTATDQPAGTERWHVNRNHRHITRHPEPEQWTDKWAVEAFTEAEKLHGTAIHEAAHTVLFCAAGIPIYSVTVRTMSEAVGTIPSGETNRGPFRATLQDVLAALCAGERAEDRWLRETGMWTTGRAWAAERSALNDRTEADGFIYQAAGVFLTCRSNGTWHDLATLHSHTDQVIAKHWASITDLADALVRERHLDAQQIASIARIDNPAAAS
ncbi:hypothetical protein [Streptomyces sp. NPDC056817]|uniref:hypothetical protein n=1 Tax=Streptomyces sp. NPDC056817 TaxID=3345950 RepID=UPI00368DDADF